MSARDSEDLMFAVSEDDASDYAFFLFCASSRVV